MNPVKRQSPGSSRWPGLFLHPTKNRYIVSRGFANKASKVSTAAADR